MDIIYLYPNSKSGQLTGTYTDVDDPYDAPDDDATYVWNLVCSSSTYSDIYGIEDQEEIGLISQVTVHYRWKTSGTAGCWCRLITHSEAYFVNENVSSPSSYKNESKVWTVNPFTDEVWTWEEINDLKIQIISRNGDGVR